MVQRGRDFMLKMVDFGYLTNFMHVFVLLLLNIL